MTLDLQCPTTTTVRTITINGFDENPTFYSKNYTINSNLVLHTHTKQQHLAKSTLFFLKDLKNSHNNIKSNSTYRWIFHLSTLIHGVIS